MGLKLPTMVVPIRLRLLLLLVVAPFLTGWLAHMQWVPYRAVITAHIITGAVWLIVIPWTSMVPMSPSIHIGGQLT